MMSVAMLGACTKKNPDVTFIMADVQEDGHPTAASSDYFASQVSEKTNGRIKIEVYHGSTLGSEADQVQQVSVDGIDFARVSSSAASVYCDDLKAFQALFLFSDDEQMWKVLDGKIGTEFLESQDFIKNSVEPLCWFSGGTRNFYNSKKEIKSVSDLSGLKFRVNTDSMFALMDAVGARGQNIAYSDILSSLKDGVVDGAENNWPSYMSTNHYTQAKYITIDQHSSVPEFIIASTQAMNELSESDQKIIRECAKEASTYQRKAMSDYEKDAIETAKKAGCKVTELTEEEKAEFEKLAEPINEKISSDYMDLINEIKAVK
ncbi:TRAP-type C4-dicarboxylate transport system, periplasmic component [Lachnospiraceae bacterium KM106-2]|nr:TRAP-type C4-dicarboxylate transport system, periplasmic component [Lachnospiraceae bacterium KM106-2]